MRDCRTAAIIIAAGYSSRMGSFKPLLKFGKYTAIEILTNTYRDAGIEDIILVVGHQGDKIIDAMNDSEAACILNENYPNGMYSSVVKGVKALSDDIQAFFLNPVDIPLIKKHTLKLLKNKYQECDKNIIYPTFHGEQGHPPLIDCKYKNTIISSAGDGGLKRILEEFSHDALWVPVFDEMILMDMDRKENYEKLLKYYHRDAPSRKECYAILNLCNVPEPVVRHCIKVAKVSMNILSKFKYAGYVLNEDVLEAAALLHDIAKPKKNHAQEGAMILKEIGYEHVGDIIVTHTDIVVYEDEKITENEILYLADKLVKEEQCMLLEERFQQQLMAYCNNAEALKKIKQRYDAAQKIMRKLEKISGEGFKYG
ncbi:MAG: DVU_1551 family NTP transferase [Thermotaleaceae bacterium]